MARLNALRTGSLVGRPVKHPRGAALGRIEDVIVDADSGRIAYVILSSDPSLGDDRLYAVPWSGFSYPGKGVDLVLDVPPERLREAPAFRRDDAPNFSDPAYAEDVYRFYNREPFWHRDTPMRSSRYAASGYTRTETEHLASRGAAGSAGLLAAVILLLVALGIVFYVLYPRETRVAAESVGRAAEETASAVVDTSEDAATTGRVKAAFALSKTVSALDIDVDSDEGVVTLTGQVPSEEAKLIAVAIAEDTAGVSRVVDRLSVASASAAAATRGPGNDRAPMASRVADVEIRVRVNEAIRNSPDLDGQRVDVSVEDGVVTLSGDVASSVQRDRAETIARNTEGVREVVNALETPGPTL